MLLTPQFCSLLIACLFCFLINPCEIIAQNSTIINTSTDRYYSDGKVMRYNELHEVFEHDVKYKERYSLALNSIKSSKQLITVSSGLLGGGLILVLIDKPKSNDGFIVNITTADQIGIFAILSAAITGSIAIVRNHSGHRKVKKIIDEYNNSIEGLGEVNKKPKLNFIEAHSGYGFGIAIQF